MKPEKIIFLDIDGVLNSKKWYYARTCMDKRSFIPTDDRVTTRDMRELDLTALGLLCKLVIDTNSKIVITSTWRMGKDPLFFRLLFNRRGIIDFPRDAFIGCTPTLHDSYDDAGNHTNRGTEIQKWIDDNKFTGKYVILDDDSDFLSHQKPFFIHTPNDEGFIYEHYFKALCILGQEHVCEDCSVGWIKHEGQHKTYVRESNAEVFNGSFHEYQIYNNCPSCGKLLKLDNAVPLSAGD